MQRRLAAAGIITAIGVAVFVAMSFWSPERPAAPAAEAPRAVQVQPLSAQAARAMLASGALLADVREPDELAALGKLEGAVNVPLTRLKQLAAHGAIPAELKAAKGRPVILYCRSGRRSGEAGAILLGQGFRQIYNLGSYEEAVKAGLPAG